MPGREGTQVSGVDNRSGVNGSVFSPLCTSFHGYLDTSLPRCRGGLADIVRATVADLWPNSAARHSPGAISASPLTC